MQLLKLSIATGALLCALVQAQAFAAPFADRNLEGTWNSVTAENGALEGTLVLGHKHELTLRAKGQPEFVGTWQQSAPGALTFEIPEAGASVLGYKLKGDRLTLTYDNGGTQAFARARPLKAKPVSKPGQGLK